MEVSLRTRYSELSRIIRHFSASVYIVNVFPESQTWKPFWKMTALHNICVCCLNPATDFSLGWFPFLLSVLRRNTQTIEKFPNRDNWVNWEDEIVHVPKRTSLSVMFYNKIKNNVLGGILRKTGIFYLRESWKMKRSFMGLETPTIHDCVQYDTGEYGHYLGRWGLWRLIIQSPLSALHLIAVIKVWAPAAPVVFRGCAFPLLGLGPPMVAAWDGARYSLTIMPH